MTTTWSSTVSNTQFNTEHSEFSDFTVIDNDCISPEVTITFTELDYGDTTAYFTIYANDSTTISECGTDDCTLTTSTCVSDYAIANISVDAIYRFTFTIESDVRRCSGNQYALYATIELTCNPSEYS